MQDRELKKTKKTKKKRKEKQKCCFSFFLPQENKFRKFLPKHIFERGNDERRRMDEEKWDVLEYKLDWNCEGGY